jgi:hypothetical protein
MLAILLVAMAGDREHRRRTVFASDGDEPYPR